MKQLTFIFIILICAFFLNYNWQNSDNGQTINPLLGDISFVQKFGCNPIETTDEDLRIKTHLEYVEGLLRQKDISSLSPAMQKKRDHKIGLLHAY
jgi:hypothetical protein